MPFSTWRALERELSPNSSDWRVTVVESWHASRALRAAARLTARQIVRIQRAVGGREAGRLHGAHALE